jgi:regulator of sirC expression with transglutaminase-like and TPR domain
MRLDLNFPDDVEFSRLVARQPEIDLVRVALELARDAYPELNFRHTLEWLGKRGDELSDALHVASSDREVLQAVGRCLAGTHGLHGDREAFSRAESSYLHRVIETGVGIPISLSTVYVAVAQRAGLDLHGVASPMHFLVRFDGTLQTYFLDAFNQGRILKYDRCLDWLQRMTDMPPDEIEPFLEPATPRDIVIRMLNNLKSVYVQQDDWQAVWPVQRRLTALQPTQYDQRRDLALVALKSMRIGLAIDLLDQCAKDAPDADAAEVVKHHRQLAERLLSTWN